MSTTFDWMTHEVMHVGVFVCSEIEKKKTYLMSKSITTIVPTNTHPHRGEQDQLPMTSDLDCEW